MRPQHITAENRHALERDVGVVAASMRPQHITAENWTWYVHALEPESLQ